MENERIYEDLVNDAIKIAFLSFRNFLVNLDLNPDAFSHLFNVKIDIDYTEDITNGACALFDPNAKDGNSMIYVGIDYLDDMYEYIDSGHSREKIVVNIANSIVHEMIHMSRVVTLKEETSILSAKDRILQEAEIYHEYSQKIKNYDDIMILSLYKYNRGRYIPIKVLIYRDNLYSLTVFDKKQQCYIEFDKQRFKTSFKGNNDRFLEELAIEASTNLMHIPSRAYPSFIASSSKTKNVYNAMDLYHGSLKKKFKGVKTKQEAIAKTDEVRNLIKWQESLEEAITETLANIIIMTRNKNFIDIETLTDKIMLSDSSLPAEKCAACFLKCCGIEKIKDFFLAPYSDEFRDIFREFFNEDYEKAVRIFDLLFQNNIKDQNQINILTTELLQIINKRKTELLV